MAKEIVFDTDKLAAGVDKLANAVKITMGPKGRTVVIDKSYGAPTATKDGVTVAKAVSLPDPQENIGARMIQEVAKKRVMMQVMVQQQLQYWHKKLSAKDAV